MKVNNIHIEEVGENGFAFKRLKNTDISAQTEQTFLFDGVVIGFCRDGEMSLSINSKRHILCGNDLFAILPKYVFSIQDHSSATELDLLFVSVDLIHKLPAKPDFDLLKRIEVQPSVTLSKEKQDELSTLYSIFINYQSDNNQYKLIRELIIASMIMIIAVSFDKTKNDNGALLTRQERVAHLFYKLLYKHFEEEHNMAFYADKLCVTPKYLSRAVKSVSGHPPQVWIKGAMLTEAKRYLRTTDMSVKQISEKLHFSNMSAFVRFFKKQLNVTPLEYRRI